jgi:hypothetical protein
VCLLPYSGCGMSCFSILAPIRRASPMLHDSQTPRSVLVDIPWPGLVKSRHVWLHCDYFDRYPGTVASRFHIRKGTDSHGSIPIVLPWDPIVQLVNISTTPVHIVSSSNALIKPRKKCQPVVIQLSNASHRLSVHTWHKFPGLHDSFSFHPCLDPLRQF